MNTPRTMTTTPITLTLDEIRVQVAEILGWTKIAPFWNDLADHPNDYFSELRGIALGQKFTDPVPDYPGSLDACHEMEKTLTLDQSTAYVNLLWPQGYATFQAIHATALQRALCFTKIRHVHNPKWEAGE